MTQTNDDKVHVEAYVHVAFPPTQSDIDEIKEKLRRSARMICDATDGKVLIDNIHLERNGQSANNADVLWLPEGQISRYITSTGGNRFGHPVAHFRVSNEVAFRAVAHEFGHLLFRLGDRYDRQRYFPHSGCGIGPSIQDTDVTVTNHSIMQEYDTICRIKASGDLTTTTCNYDLDCEEPFEECYEFSPKASEFNTNNPTFERIRGDTDDGVAWPGISKGEKLWLDSRLYVDLTANWTWADRSIEFIDEVGNLALQSSHRIWLRARKVAANTYELEAYMGTSANDDYPLIWSVNSTDTDTLTLEFDPTATNCGKKAHPLNASLLEINGLTTWAIKLKISAEQLVGDSPSYTGGDAELDVDLKTSVNETGRSPTSPTYHTRWTRPPVAP